MPQNAVSAETICQFDECRALMSGNPPRRKLAAKAPTERKMPRTRDFCRNRKMEARGRTNFNSSAAGPNSQRGQLRISYRGGLRMQAIDKVSTVTIAVTDQDEALQWYTEKLGFEKRVDQRSPAFRWLTVAPPQQVEVEFLLASWFPDSVGRNATWVLSTRDCQGGYEELKAKGVEFSQKPEVRPYGIEAVFADLYGNKYALVQESAQVLTDEATKEALGLPEGIIDTG